MQNTNSKDLFQKVVAFVESKEEYSEEAVNKALSMIKEVLNPVNEGFNSIHILKRLDLDNFFRKYFESKSISLNIVEYNYLDVIVDKILDLQSLFSYDNSSVDTRDIINIVEEMESIFNDIKLYNKEYIGDFSNYDSIEQYSDLILDNGVSEVFINILDNALLLLFKEDIPLDQLNKIEDFKYGATLYFNGYFNSLEYLENLGYFSNLPYEFKQYIDQKGLKKEITTGKYEIFGKKYITV